MPSLAEEFQELSARTRELIDLLEQAEESYWVGYFQRGLQQVDEQRLSGATFILGCYGGEDTFSDWVIGKRWEHDEPLRFRALNARLSRLRTETFDAANAITSRRSW